MNAADLHKKLDEALELLDVAERRFTAERERNRRLGEPEALSNLRARDTQEMRDCMADWQLAHQRIQSYGTAAMAKDLAEFLRPDVFAPGQLPAEGDAMSRPVLLDLFCGAGGAAMGYHRAGFDVVGVDVKPQPRYPFEFHQADALSIVRGMLDYPTFSGEMWRPGYFAAVHASPPCHDHSTVTGRNRKAVGPKGTGWMLAATLEGLAALGLPYIVENVETAEFPGGVYRIRLCGSTFGLDVRRHRWFASNVAMLDPGCAHHEQKPRFRSLDSRQKGLASVIGVHGHLNYAGEFELRCKAMGIDWMTNDELSQAIPPAYTRFIGEQLLAHLGAEAR